MAPYHQPRRLTPVRWHFDGEIAAFGTTAGYRIVVGRWPLSPFGPISDVMVETPDGTRLLLAPSEQVAGFIASTYRFDAVDVTTLEIVRGPGSLGPPSPAGGEHQLAGGRPGDHGGAPPPGARRS